MSALRQTKQIKPQLRFLGGPHSSNFKLNLFRLYCEVHSKSSRQLPNNDPTVNQRGANKQRRTKSVEHYQKAFQTSSKAAPRSRGAQNQSNIIKERSKSQQKRRSEADAHRRVVLPALFASASEEGPAERAKHLLAALFRIFGVIKQAKCKKVRFPVVSSGPESTFELPASEILETTACLLLCLLSVCFALLWGGFDRLFATRAAPAFGLTASASGDIIFEDVLPWKSAE